MLLRDIFIIVMMVSGVSIVMTSIMVDFQDAGYEFNTTSEFNDTYSKISQVTGAGDTAQSNLEGSRDLVQSSTSGDISWVKSVGNAITMVVNSFSYITGSGGLIDSASNDLGLDTNNGWIKSIVITSFIVTITFIIASLWLRHKA